MSAITKLFGGILLFIGSIFAPHATAPTLGAAPGCSSGTNFSPIQTQPFFLSGSGITANATSVLLTSMEYDNGTAISMCDIGVIGFATIDPGNSKEEQVSFTNITQNTNGSAVLTGVTRGLAFNPGTQGCNGSSTLAVSHSGSAQFVLSNTACFYQQYAALSNSNVWTGSSTVFTNAPTVTNTSTASNALVTYQQLASTSFSGTVNASTSQKGIVQLATAAQIASGTSVGSSGASLVIPNSASSLTASTTDVSVIASGTIDPSFLLNGNYSLGQLISASTTLNNTTTASGTVILPNLPSVTLGTNASGTIMASSLGGILKTTYSTSTTVCAGTATSTIWSFYPFLNAGTSSVYDFPIYITYGTNGGGGGSTAYINLGTSISSTTLATQSFNTFSGGQQAFDIRVYPLASTSTEMSIASWNSTSLNSLTAYNLATSTTGISFVNKCGASASITETITVPSTFIQ